MLGIVQGVFQIQAMFDTMLGNIRTPVRLYLFSADATADDLPIYYSSRLDAGSIEAQTQSQLSAGLHRAFAMHLGDVKWTLVVTPEVPDLLLAGHKGSTIVLICGLLLSAGTDVVHMGNAPSRPYH